MGAFLQTLRRVAGLLVTLIPAVIGLFVLYRLSPTGAFWWWTELGIIAAIVVLFIGFPFTGLVEYYTIYPNRNRDLLLLEPDGEARANAYEAPPDPRGLFTPMQPGRAKIIVTVGGRFVKIIMDYPEHLFWGERDDNTFRPNDRAYWRVVLRRRNSADRDSHPIPFPLLTGRAWYRAFFLGVNLPWWAWKRYIYWFKGVIWVGPSWFRRVRIYPMPHSHLERIERRTEVREGGERVTEVTYRTKEVNDYSDHYRVNDFQFPVEVPDANCLDNIPVRAIVNYIGRTENPWSLAYDTDDLWPRRLATQIAGAVTDFAQINPVSGVIAAKAQDSASLSGVGSSALAKYVARIGWRKPVVSTTPPVPGAPTVPSGTLPEPNKTALKDKDDAVIEHGTFATDGQAAAFGVITARSDDNGEFILPQVPEVSPVNKADTQKLSEPAFAQARMEAGLRDAKIPAAYIREESAAIAEHRESGALIAQLRAQVETATAATQQPGGIVVLKTGGDNTPTDPTQLAILAELRRLRGGGAAGGGTSGNTP